MTHRTLFAGLIAGGTLALSQPILAAGERVAVVTPYLSAIATAEMVESFQQRAADYDWTVEVFDTAGDIGAMASRIEDVTTSGVDAIVIVSIDPAQLQDQVDRAADANIPIIAIDGSLNEAVALNVTSDNYVLGQTMTDYLFDQLGGEGSIVRLFHSAHPGVRQREIALDDALEAYPGISEVAQHYVQVPGQIDDSRSAMDSILLANQHEGAIDAVWAAWDEPGIGAQLALEAAGRDGIIIAGIDGNPQAIELIESCTSFVATVRQGFSEMAEIAAEELQQIFDGAELAEPERYAPVELITRDSLGVSCD
ncbi:sugar ABC transporter substrate-binding protein [Pelagibacterium lentulum]|uniref:Sugar ABC transporter substrate-binding protein n=1 Tax=Pelagibacterium lentulum TaxID=2029865 RepID=A0A916R7W6_9HYPH|nr:substrate-binding domain-containing protein [Pelagibacterium lentulum]GGA42691.1 sugar ABC transporter substrate-binding protein [Pelagibacterium lentulum]